MELTESEWLSKVNSKFDDLADWHTRQDTDKDIIRNSPYVMKSLNNKSNEPDIANVTLPIGQLYSESVVDNIIGMDRQVSVEGDINDKEAAIIEDFIDDLSFEIDNQLCQSGDSSEISMLADYICNRGAGAELNKIDVVDGKLKAKVQPIDPRWMAWEFGDDGLAWGAPMYKRSKGDIQAEYGIETSDSEEQVIDLWTPKKNITWVGSEIVRNIPNPYGFVPIVFQGVATGSALREEKSLAYKWESIFYSSRELFKEVNFIASVLKTQNYGANKPPLQLPSSPDGELQPRPDAYPMPGTVSSVKQPIQQVNTGDLKQYTVKYNEIITQLVNQATFNSLDLGNIDFQLSGTAIQILGEKRSRLQLPRLTALAMLLRRSNLMRIRQVLTLGQSVKLGEPGFQRTYLPRELQGEYTINYRFYSLSAADLAANTALANTMGTLVSNDYKRRYVLKLKDPDGEGAKVDAEMTKQIDPVISLIDQGLALIDENTDESDIKARRIYNKIIGILKQEKMAESQPLSTDIERGSIQKQNPTQALPLFGRGGVNG